MFVLSDVIAGFYTNIEVVAVAAAQLFRFMCFYSGVNALQCIACGILRGMGKTVPATVVTFISYYVISIPLQLYLTFYLDYGLYGLWTGQLIGSTFQVFANQYLISLRYGDWSVILEEARVRLIAD
jgi:MATE family multidrug resistance protein